MILVAVAVGLEVVGKPRASGDDPPEVRWQFHYLLVNPARAGMILQCGWVPGAFRGKPRASGDDPFIIYWALTHG